MKKALFFITLVTLFTASSAMAESNVSIQYQHPKHKNYHRCQSVIPQHKNAGGFNDLAVTPVVTTVANIKNIQANSRVILIGHLVHSLGHGLYQFKDDSGIVTVSINHRTWQKLTIKPEDKIEITGRVNRNTHSTEIINVKHLSKIKSA
ncbi:MAG: NirD/YgiW/YdeI family stress tolerance protein [Candidatus Schmidhempelia sp.]|nr:NirD/YgiW/YdeI family stress tolerance protein [Candidatus Schmidhempelia sp.]